MEKVHKMNKMLKKNLADPEPKTEQSNITKVYDRNYRGNVVVCIELSISRALPKNMVPRYFIGRLIRNQQYI